MPLLSKTAAEWAEKVGSDRLRARKVREIFIPAAESLPRQGTGIARNYAFQKPLDR